MQIGIRAHDMEHVPIEQLVTNIANKGFKACQLALPKSITNVHTDVSAMTPGFALYLKRLFADAGVDVSVLGCYYNLADPNPENLKNTMEIYKAHIRFASLLGCGMVGTETGAVNSEYKFEEANHSKEALDIFVNNLREVVDYAEKMGVIVAIEPVATHIVSNAERARYVLDAINSPNLQIIFDPVNLITSDNYMKQNEVINSVFDILGKEIACIHSKDFIVEKNGSIKQCITGDGLLDYDLILNWIKINKPYIHVLLEETRPENVFDAILYLEKVWEGRRH